MREDNRPKINSHYLAITNDFNIKNNFGFICNPSLTIWDNKLSVLANMHPNLYFKKINTNAYHNLCTFLPPPPEAGTLLGLGLKFCIKSPAPDKNSLEYAFKRFRRDVRLKFLFADNEDSNDELNPQLYIKSDWEPPQACKSIEDRISNFEHHLTTTRKRILKTPDLHPTCLNNNTICSRH